MTWDYDVEDKLIAENDPQSASGIRRYTYSGDGLRGTASDDLSITTFVWDGNDYLGEYTAAQPGP